MLGEAEADALLDLKPTANVNPDLARESIERLVAGLDAMAPVLERLAAQRAADLQAEHERVRDIAALRGRTTVSPQLPVDVLGVYVFLPARVA
jgi:hypothetical protein